jgi:hypothetical protein
MPDEKDSDDGLRGGVGRMMSLKRMSLDPDRGDVYETSPRLQASTRVSTRASARGKASSER